jgi:hypothetical protein
MARCALHLASYDMHGLLLSYSLSSRGSLKLAGHGMPRSMLHCAMMMFKKWCPEQQAAVVRQPNQMVLHTSS